MRGPYEPSRQTEGPRTAQPIGDPVAELTRELRHVYARGMIAGCGAVPVDDAWFAVRAQELLSGWGLIETTGKSDRDE